MRRTSACVLAVLLTLSTSMAAAQEGGSAADRDAAATAYDRGTSSFLSHEYPRAAQWFETAYRLAPNAQALLGAIRSHERAGDLLRAGTLSLRAQAFHADDEALARQAAATLAQATPLYLRVDVACSSDCTVELDGTVQSHTSFFVTPNSEHHVIATFETGTAESSVSGGAGETRSIALEAPPAPVAAVGDEDGSGSAPVPGSGGGLSPAFVITGAVLTAAAGGVLIWSGIDTLDGVPAYQMTPTVEGLADGQMRETRTNVMIGVTAGLAVTTLVLALFTDWDGDPPSSDAADPSIEATSVSVAPVFDATGNVLTGGALSVSGRF